MTNKEGQKRRLSPWAYGLLVLVLLLLGIYIWIGPTVITAMRRGFLDSTPERTYTATQEGNLKALYTALLGYHDSEGHFPNGAGWMDSIEHRIHAADLTPQEAEKKFIDPSVKENGSAVFGWAFNDAASEKYKDDIKDQSTLLVFSSNDTSRNAHGSPDKLLPKKPRAGGNVGITVAGKIVHLPQPKSH